MTKKANGDTEDVDEESAGRNPRYAVSTACLCWLAPAESGPQARRPYTR